MIFSSIVSIGIHHSPSFTNLINRQSVKPMVEEYPEDGNVTRRVKRAYGQIDAFRFDHNSLKLFKPNFNTFPSFSTAQHKTG